MAAIDLTNRRKRISTDPLLGSSREFERNLGGVTRKAGDVARGAANFVRRGANQLFDPRTYSPKKYIDAAANAVSPEFKESFNQGSSSFRVTDGSEVGASLQKPLINRQPARLDTPEVTPLSTSEQSSDVPKSGIAPREIGRDLLPSHDLSSTVSVDSVRRPGADLSGGVSFTGADGSTRTLADSTNPDVGLILSGVDPKKYRANLRTQAVDKRAAEVEAMSPSERAEYDQAQKLDGAMSRIEGKVISIGDSGGGGSLANFVTSRNAARSKTRGETALQERSDKFALAEQKSALERRDKTFSLSPGEQQFDASGNVIAKGSKKEAKQTKFLPEIQAEFKTDDGLGNESFDIEAMAEFEQFMKDYGITDQRKAYSLFAGLMRQGETDGAPTE